MKITYDVTALPERNRGTATKSEEVLAIIAFLATSKKNMVIEYDGPNAAKDCKRRYDAIRNYRNNNKLQAVFDVYRRDNQIVVLKLKKPGRPTAPTENN